MGAEEPLLALEFGVVIANIVVRLIHLRLHVAVTHLERIQSIANDTNLHVGSRDRHRNGRSSRRFNLTVSDMLIF